MLVVFVTVCLVSFILLSISLEFVVSVSFLAVVLCLVVNNLAILLALSVLTLPVNGNLTSNVYSTGIPAVLDVVVGIAYGWSPIGCA